MNQDLYKKLLNATRYFQTIKNYDEEIQCKTLEIEKLESESTKKVQDAIESFKGLKKFLKIVIIACSALLLLCFIVSFIVEATQTDFIVIGIAIVADIVAVHTLIKSTKKHKKFMEDEDEYYDTVTVPQIEKIGYERKDIRNEKEEFCNTNVGVISFLPASYRNINAVSYMLLAVIDGRADTLKEVFNLYEEQLHRWRMENIAKQNAEAQKILAMAVEELNLRQEYTNENLIDIKNRLNN